MAPGVKAISPQDFQLIDWGPKQGHVGMHETCWFNYSCPASLLDGITEYHGSIHVDESDGSITWFGMDYGIYGGSEGYHLSLTTGLFDFPHPYEPGPINFTLDFSFNGAEVIQNFTIMIDPIHPALVASILCNKNFGEDSLDVHFDSNITGGYEPYKMLWDFGDGNSSTIADPEHYYEKPGNYWVTLNITDRDKGQVKQKINILVVAINTSANKATWYPSHIQFTSDINIGETQLSGNWYPRYYWDFGDGYNSTDPNPEHTYSQTRNYQVYLTVTFGSNSTVTKELVVDIQDTTPWGDVVVGIGILVAVIMVGTLSTFYLHRRKKPPQ